MVIDNLHAPDHHAVARSSASSPMRVPVLIATLLHIASPAVAAETIAGTASVIDGDTLEIQGKRIRLHGIDAPESAQLCQDAAGKDWRCGQRAALALSDRIARRPVSCCQTTSRTAPLAP